LASVIVWLCDYRLEAEGELSERAARLFEGMSLRHDNGNTVLVGPIRD
jgi:hypothetical protein